MKIKNYAKLLFLVVTAQIFVGCAGMRQSNCIIEKVDPWLAESSYQYDKYTFKIIYNGRCFDEDRKGILANKVMEDFKSENNYKKFVVTHINMTKLNDGKIYAVLFMK